VTASVQFGIGQPLRRKEDARLLTGNGRFVADHNQPNETHAWFVRATEAHGRLTSVETDTARAMPGVLGVYTAADLGDALGPMPVGVRPKFADGSPMKVPAQTMLATDRVRYVGDTVAMVIAETADQARDAAEAVIVDIDALPVVIDPRAALTDGAAQLWDNVPGNLCFDWEAGDASAVNTAFAEATHIVSLDVTNDRVVIGAMETRGGLAVYDRESERFTLQTASQMPHPLRGELAKIFDLPEDRFRVLVDDVGGGFGIKN